MLLFWFSKSKAEREISPVWFSNNFFPLGMNRQGVESQNKCSAQNNFLYHVYPVTVILVLTGKKWNGLMKQKL